ncbi:hypothetical protein ABPG75_010115 [Micractinium tetrahymenae]
MGRRAAWIELLALSLLAASAAAALCPAKKGLKGRSCKPCADPLCSDCQANYRQCRLCTAELWDPSNPISYYVAAATGKCTRCDTSPPTKNCDVAAGCFPNGRCRKCARGYGMVNGMCKPCGVAAGGKGCQNCDGNTAVCKQCVNIEKDDSVAFITGRNSAFTLIGSKCVQCTASDCAACPGNAAVCRRCLPGTTLSGGRCIGCAAGCGYGGGGACSASGKCTKCDSYFGLVAGVCKDCEDPNDLCAACDGNTKRCTRCIPGMGVALSGGACVKCLAPNCLSCATPGSPCSKGGCAPGYGLVGGRCTKCANKGCVKCEGNASRCTACQLELDDSLNFYFLDPATQTCAAFRADIS